MLHRAKWRKPEGRRSARRVHLLRVMKQALLAVSLLSLVSVACAVDPFSNVAASGEAGSDLAAAGSADPAGAAGAAGSSDGGKATVGHGGKPAAGAAGKSSSGGAGAAGSPVAGSGGSAAGSTAGSAGSAAAGAPAGGSAGAGTVTPTCSAADAFARSTAPSGPLTIDAWSGAFAGDNVCWQQAAASCTFEVDSWGPSPINAARYRVFLKNVKCDASVYFGQGTADACDIKGDCNAFDGSNASIVAIDFDLAPGGEGYVASNMEQMASNVSGSGGNCEIASSPASDILATAAEDLLAGVVFSCGK